MSTKPMTRAPSFLLLLAALAGCSSPSISTHRADAPNRFAEIKAKAEAGDAKAQYNLGLRYAEGGSEIETGKWFRLAAEQGLAQAQCDLGVCYNKGVGVAKDAVEAVRWYRQAANQGYAEAQFHLGVCYQNGQGVAKDVVEAVEWYRQAAEQG